MNQEELTNIQSELICMRDNGHPLETRILGAQMLKLLNGYERCAAALAEAERENEILGKHWDIARERAYTAEAEWGDLKSRLEACRDSKNAYFERMMEHAGTIDALKADLAKWKAVAMLLAASLRTSAEEIHLEHVGGLVTEFEACPNITCREQSAALRAYRELEGGK